ncbi:response regulator, partial [Acidobacteriota bacterium]
MSDKSKILIVDDDTKILRTLEMMLSVEEKGYEIVTAGGAEEALQKLEEGGFKLVLTDIRMPRMD